MDIIQSFLNNINNQNAFNQNAFNQQSTPPPTSVHPSTRDKAEFCRVCDVKIYKEGKRNQGPKRHIQQFHLKEPMFKCSLGDYSSKFDEGHVRVHIKQKHVPEQGAEVINMADQFSETIEYWYDKCFGLKAQSIKSKGFTKYVKNRLDERQNSSSPSTEFSTPSPSTSRTVTPDSVPFFSMEQFQGSPFLQQQVPVVQPMMNDQMFQMCFAMLASNPWLAASMTNLVQETPVPPPIIKIEEPEEAKSSFMIKDILNK